MGKRIGLTAALLAGTWLLGACTSSIGGAQSGTAPEEPQSAPQSQGSNSTVTEEPQSGFISAEQWWERMDERERAASVLMLHYPGADSEAIARFVEDFSPAGMILMGDNIPEDESELKQSLPMWADSGELPLLVGIDQEGGIVSRVKEDPGRPAVELRDGDPAVTEESFANRGEYLESLGINTNFGIIADSTNDQDSFIWSRILGTSPQIAADQVAAAVEGESGKVYSALKHFPGHGESESDSHFTIPRANLNYDEWRAGPALPFAAGIDAGAEMVMMGHLSFPDIAPEPASISPQWHRILREDLEFEGIIVTDDMKMLRDQTDSSYAEATANAVAALNAGSTLILDIGGDSGADANEFAGALIDGIVLSVRNGILSEETLKDASMRVIEARAELKHH